MVVVCVSRTREAGFGGLVKGKGVVGCSSYAHILISHTNQSKFIYVRRTPLGKHGRYQVGGASLRRMRANMEKKFVEIDLDSIDMVQKAHYGCLRVILGVLLWRTATPQKRHVARQ